MARAMVGVSIAAGLAAAFILVGGTVERWAVLAAIAALAAALAWPGRRPPLLAAAAVLLVAATAALVGHFLNDDFAYRYVWLYSAPPLPWYLKLASLWSGDEGTLLLLAALAAVGALRLSRYRGWAGPGAAVVALVLAVGAAVWNPFVATAPDELAKAASLGMNAHLTRVWMAFHPPAIFIAYGFLLLPAGAALEALARGGGDWRFIAARWTRLGWLALSLGLATGMWWAYEDLTFGQFWHWDPVQTSIFLVWVAATAHLHTLRRYHPEGYFRRLNPALGALTAILVLTSMAVTRSPLLASSHRYVGDTSLPLLAAGAVALTLLGIVALGLAVRRRGEAVRHDAGAKAVYLATLLLLAGGGVAAWHLVEAVVGGLLGLPRPAEVKPFFETLARWAPGDELARLRQSYAQWDVNNFSLNRWMAPVGVLIGLVGGHFFLPARSRAARWATTIAAVGATAALALLVKPFAGLYAGDGMTSNKTVAILPWLDALIAAMGYLTVAVIAWAATRMAATGGRRRSAGYYLPLVAVHVGATVALVAFLAATVNDTYAQKMVRFPEDFGKPIRFPDGFTVTVELAGERMTEDGGPSPLFESRARVRFTRAEEDEIVADVTGQTIYRDTLPPGVAGQGSVRLMCEMIDYRYARYAGGKTRMMHPFIHRGLWRDVQVWFPAVDYAAAPRDEASLAGQRQPGEVPVVLKTFPMVTWLWAGLAALILGGLAAAVMEWRRDRR